MNIVSQISQKFIYLLLITSVFASYSFATTTEEPPVRAPNGVIDFLPLWKEPVYDYGSVPPKPFFIAPLFFYLNEKRNITDVKANLDLGGSITPINGVVMDSVVSETFSTGIRAGFWLFPFLSIYGMYAYTEGSTSFDISAPGLESTLALIDTVTPITVHTGGVGITAAYGIPKVFFGTDIFSNIDFNSSWSKVSLLDDQLFTLAVSLRAGLARKFAKHLRIATWVGGMYRGGTAVSTKVGGVYPVGSIGTATYTANQSALSPWSMAAGMQISITRYFDIITEFGFLNRFQANVNLSFNF